MDITINQAKHSIQKLSWYPTVALMTELEIQAKTAKTKVNLKYVLMAANVNKME